MKELSPGRTFALKLKRCKMKKFLIVILSFAFLPLCAQRELVIDKFPDLFFEENQKKDRILKELDQVDSLFSLEDKKRNEKPSECVEALAQKQQNHFLQSHSLKDLTTQKEPSQKKR